MDAIDFDKHDIDIFINVKKAKATSSGRLLRSNRPLTCTNPQQIVRLVFFNQLGLLVGRSDIFQFYLHNGKFCNSVLHLKTAAVTMH